MKNIGERSLAASDQPYADDVYWDRESPPFVPSQDPTVHADDDNDPILQQFERAVIVVVVTALSCPLEDVCRKPVTRDAYRFACVHFITGRSIVACERTRLHFEPPPSTAEPHALNVSTYHRGRISSDFAHPPGCPLSSSRSAWAPWRSFLVGVLITLATEIAHNSAPFVIRYQIACPHRELPTTSRRIDDIRGDRIAGRVAAQLLDDRYP